MASTAKAKSAPSTDTLSASATARTLGVTIQYVYTLLWAGKMAGTRDGDGRWRIAANVVEEWREGHK